MNAREALIALNMVEHVGPVRLRQMLDHFGTPLAILQATRADLQRISGVGEETAEAISQWEDRIDLSGELQRIEQYGCRVLIQEDEEYPDLLRQIYDPPIVLYLKGKVLPQDKSGVALVGSRQTTHY